MQQMRQLGIIVLLRISYIIASTRKRQCGALEALSWTHHSVAQILVNLRAEQSGHSPPAYAF